MPDGFPLTFAINTYARYRALIFIARISFALLDLFRHYLLHVYFFSASHALWLMPAYALK